MTLKWKLKKFRRAVRLKLKNLIWQEVLVLGDSHSLVFRRKSMGKAFPGVFFHVVGVGGATLSGLNNPDSKTQAGPRLLEGLSNSRADLALVQMGEVDTGFVLWGRAERHGKDVSEMLEEAVENYKSFLLQVKAKMAVICISTPLPTIPDGVEWGEVAFKRKSVKAGQRARTELTLQLNRMMEEFCRQNGMEYLSLDDESRGEDGLVHPRLLNSDPRDHHYEAGVYEELLVEALKKSPKMSAIMEGSI
ncbi:MAG: hypothetical protein P1V20_15740 [Verrucomicrobiales bacterium]|nr:hypothetical protein [Verrucomicrobiales bacterium]